jgi:hypothetical protein
MSGASVTAGTVPQASVSGLATSLQYLDATSSIQGQIDGKANSSALSYLDATSSIQTQLDDVVAVDISQGSSIASKASTSGANILTGTTVLRQALNVSEVVQVLTVSSSVLSYNFANGGVCRVVPEAAAAFELALTNVNPSSSTTTTATVTLLIDCQSYESYATTLRINGTLRTLLFPGGVASVDVSGATYIMQTVSICYSGNSSIPVCCISSCTPMLA